MKLFEVEVTTVVYVWAENDHRAERLAVSHIDDESFHETNASEVTGNSYVHSSWDDGIPYGKGPEGFDNLTVDEIRDKWKEQAENEPFVDLLTLPLPLEGDAK